MEHNPDGENRNTELGPRTPALSVAFQGDKSVAAYTALAAQAEAYGFDTVSVYADLMYQPAIFPLLMMAQHTSRVRLGPAALNPSLLHPVEIAGQIAALDAVSGGRAYLGLARGAWLDSLGIADPRPIQRLREAIAVITRLLAGDERGYAGEFYRLTPGQGLRYDRVRSRVPLLIGTWGANLARLAGEVADEIKIGGSANPAMVPLMRHRLAAGAARADRPPGDVGIVLGAVTVVADDRAAARELARREVALYLPVVAPLDPTVEAPPELLRRIAALVAAGAHGEAGSLVPDSLLDRFAFAGTPTDIIHQTEAVFAAGSSRVEYGTPQGLTTETGLRLLGERVLPAFR